MNDPYIVAFPAGSSGRFVAYILYSLLSNTSEPFLVEEDNSTHLFNSMIGVDFSTCSNPNNHDIYHKESLTVNSPELFLKSFKNIELIKEPKINLFFKIGATLIRKKINEKIKDILLNFI